MTQTIPGIHHVTAIAIDPQANIRYRAKTALMSAIGQVLSGVGQALS
jgi:hypothetical protein